MRLVAMPQGLMMLEILEHEFPLLVVRLSKRGEKKVYQMSLGRRSLGISLQKFPKEFLGL